MIGPRPVRRLFLMMLAPLACASIVLPAAPGGAAEAGKLSATEVAEGLNTIQVIAGDVVSAATEKAKASMIAEGIDPIWERIEGTIKANDANSYTTMEKGLEGLVAAAKAGDAAKAGGSAGVIASAVKFYVAKFPGDAPAAAPAERKAAAAPEKTTAGAEKKPAAESKPAAEAKSPEPAPAPSGSRAAAADAPAAAAEGGTLARTGLTNTLTALAGAAFGLGGLAVIGGARHRRQMRTR